MAKFLMFFMVIVLVIVGVLLVAYFRYEKPKQHEVNIEMINLTIYSFDVLNDTQVSTNFEVYKDGVSFYNETTLEEGGLFLEVPTNHTYSIKNVNKFNQNYYTDYIEASYFGNGFNKRINLNLEKPSNLSVIDREDYNQNINLLIEGYNIKNLTFCVKWSVNVITIKTIENYSVIEKYPEYDDYDKCFDLHTILNGELDIPVYITKLANLDSRDYVDFMFIDRDCYNNQCLIEENGKDLGLKDVFYEVKY